MIEVNADIVKALPRLILVIIRLGEQKFTCKAGSVNILNAMIRY
jgi:hypothetical protein